MRKMPNKVGGEEEGVGLGIRCFGGDWNISGEGER